MAQTIYIGLDDTATYDPDPPVVQPGDSVTFVLVDRRDQVTVDFGPNSPFMVYSLQIDGPHLTVSPPREIRSNASDGRYNFTANPAGPRGPIGPDQPGTVTGGLEVSRDPPSPPEE